MRAGGEDHRFSQVYVAGIATEAERTPGEVEFGNQIGDDLGSDMGRLLLHLLHQPRTLDHVGEARIVLHIGGDGELAAGLDALDQNRFQHRPRGIDRGGVAGGTGTDDDDFGVDGGGHGQIPLSSGRFVSAEAESARKRVVAV